MRPKPRELSPRVVHIKEETNEVGNKESKDV